MFDVAPSEFFLVALVALVVIGPKDLPKALRFAGYWIGKARGVARQFRSGFDTMVREAELAEMEKKWAEENARILAEHPAEPAGLPDHSGVGTEAEAASGQVAAEPVHDDREPDLFAAPIMVEKPVVVAGDTPAAADAKAAS